MLPNFIIIIFAAVLGLIFGSFVTALSYRLPRGISIAAGRSRCPACDHQLGVGDLFPVLSWLFSGGACRHCSVKISPRYPFIELSTALLTVSAVLFLRDPAQAVIAVLMTPAVMALAVIDLEHRLLPNVLVAVLAGLSVLWRWQTDGDFVTGFIMAAVIFAGVVLLDRGYRAITGRSGLGMGDAKLMAAMGLALAPFAYTAFLLLAGVLGVMLGLGWRLSGRSGAFPFGPALLASFWAVLLAEPLLTGLVLQPPL